jgi:dual specificity tyrosine-phosphorylation-regulated kinase 1
MEAPVRKLSVNMLKTYKYINQVYYENKRKRQAQAQAGAQARTYNDGHDDEHSDYIIRVGERINGRYLVHQKIGKGSFGQVVRALDEKRNETVAIKIIKSRRQFTNQAKTEISLLSELNAKESQRGDKQHVVRLFDTFVHHNHQCLVFEMLSYNLYDLLRNTKFFGVSLNLIRKFARQILKALDFLAREDINIIHCDLKPENILLCHMEHSAIKIIDFGSSCKSEKQMYSYIQSRFYRSPEVILGRPYTVAIDMWSLGCIVMELHTGEPLLSGTDEHDQIMRMVAIRGMPPDEMLHTATKTMQFFEHKTPLEMSEPPHGERPSSFKLLDKKGKQPERELAKCKNSLEEILWAEDGPATRRAGEAGHSKEMYALFFDLVDKMLAYDPDRRIRPKAALEHPFIVSDQTPQRVTQPGAQPQQPPQQPPQQQPQQQQQQPPQQQQQQQQQQQPPQQPGTHKQQGRPQDHVQDLQQLQQQQQRFPVHQSVPAPGHLQPVQHVQQQHAVQQQQTSDILVVKGGVCAQPVAARALPLAQPSSALQQQAPQQQVQQAQQQATVPEPPSEEKPGEARQFYAKRPGSAPAAAVGGNATLRRSSRVAKQQALRGTDRDDPQPSALASQQQHAEQQHPDHEEPSEQQHQPEQQQEQQQLIQLEQQQQQQQQPPQPPPPPA